MNLRINSSGANLRVTPDKSQARLALLPVGHPVVALAEPEGNWRPCQTQLDGNVLNGFIHTSVLRAEINPEVDRLIELAGAEFMRFHFGTRHETHPDSKARIKEYWLSFTSPDRPVSEPWSAAFISFVVKRAHLTTSFEFSGRHTTYLSDSKRAKLGGDRSRAYWAVRLDERRVEIGDLIGAFRTGSGCGSAVKTYDSLPGDFCSHVDLVVAVRGNQAITIGGNVGNTVMVTEVPLTPAGHAAEGSKRITTMARNF